jgi:glucokinase
MEQLVGIDIGGTKCAVCVGQLTATSISVTAKQRFLTPSSPRKALNRCADALDAIITTIPDKTIRAIGISCGGPLDSRKGLILAPPNLPGWDCVDVITPFQKRFGIPVALQNDANACALAEWRWGAGQGCKNLIFLTFGTGMGAGLILDNRLYSGTNDLGGEVGHIRLADKGPIGYGKAGSFEGFCSGGGIARLAQERASRAIRSGNAPSFCAGESDLHLITAESVGCAAQQGDPLAIHVYETVGYYLGRGLAILVDILNPEMIIIGSIYGRQKDLLETITLRSLREEALTQALSVCKIVPAGLGEQVGDMAGLAVAQSALDSTTKLNSR